MALLKNAADLWDVDDIPTRDVECPEWRINGEPVTIRLRGLTAAEVDRYENSLTRVKNGQQVQDATNARARLVSWSAVDEGGNKLFRGEEAMIKLGSKSAKALQRLFTAAAELSGLTEGDVDSLVGDFSDAPDGPSHSD